MNTLAKPTKKTSPLPERIARIFPNNRLISLSCTWVWAWICVCAN